MHSKYQNTYQVTLGTQNLTPIMSMTDLYRFLRLLTLLPRPIQIFKYEYHTDIDTDFLNPIPYGISIPAMPPQLKTYLGLIDSNFFIHTNKTMSN